MEGWAQWLVFGVLILFTGALAFAIGPTGPARAGPNRHRRFLDQLEEDHLGRVGATRAELDDPGVAAVAPLIAGRDLHEQLVDRELVLAELDSA